MENAQILFVRVGGNKALTNVGKWLGADHQAKFPTYCDIVY